ncbi:MAG: hydroxymethylbilane synthase [Alphaproteobacteria bacterium]
MTSSLKNENLNIGVLKLGTRASPLAMIQARDMAARIKNMYPQVDVELVKFTSTGDRVQDRALAEIGGKGLFAKELEMALLDGKIDLAVHSMKDLETSLPAGLALAAVTEREDPQDVLICAKAKSIAELPQNARVGTASARRAAQLLALRPDLKISLIRGNVGTRLGKIESGEFDATILAAAGLKRLDLLKSLMDEGKAHLIPLDLMPPAVAQGIVGIEVKAETLDDPQLAAFYASLNDADGWAQATLERRVLFELDGSCKSAISCFCQIDGDSFTLEAAVYQPEGKKVWSDAVSGPLDRSTNLKDALALVGQMGSGLAKRATNALDV